MMLSLLPGCSAWVTMSQWNGDSAASTLSTIRYRNGAVYRLWSMPEGSMETGGLAGGITYAWDPELCDSLLPKFTEDSKIMPSFVTCGTLRAAMARAFYSWSAHHPMLHFHDVTQECEAAEDVTGGPGGVGCSLAEIWITNLANDSNVATATEAAAAAQNYYSWTDDFTFTNGERASHGVFATVGSRLSFSTDLCWYLDTTFCSYFHSLKRAHGSSNVLLGWRTMLFMLWAASIVEMAWSAYKSEESTRQLYKMRIKGASFDDADAVKEALSEDASALWYDTIEKLSKVSACRMASRLVLFFVPPTFYWEVFLPCWDCYDFETAAIHEIGHVLGLEHPDAAAERGTNVRQRPPAEGEALPSGCTGQPCNCTKTWESVETAPADAIDTLQSVMMVFTQNPPEPCVMQDDLEAINTIYPLCSNRVQYPQCFKVQSFIGYVRLGLYVVIPTALMLVMAVSCHTFVVQALKRNRAKLREENKDMLSAEDTKYEQHKQRLLQAKKNNKAAAVLKRNFKRVHQAKARALAKAGKTSKGGEVIDSTQAAEHFLAWGEDAAKAAKAATKIQAQARGKQARVKSKKLREQGHDYNAPKNQPPNAKKRLQGGGPMDC